MRHFDLVHWTDFVRGIADPADRAAVQQHLASGCPECGHSVALLERVVAASRAEVHYQVPEGWVAKAKAIMAPQPAARGLDLPRMVVRLLYDSFRDPLPVGIRSGERSRQALYEAGDYCLDLRLESELGRRQFSLTGQIANRKSPNQPMAGTPVLLLSGDRVLTSRQSNAFGEFQLDLSYEPKLRLCVPMVSLGKRIDLSLRPLFGRRADWLDSEGRLV